MEQSLLTNERIIGITISLISVLASGLALTGYWIFRRVLSEIKTYRKESLTQRAEFNSALNNKFRALNYYMKQTDKLQIKHEEKIIGFHEHARDVKQKLIEHDEKFEKHSNKLAQHDIEIQNLKKTG